MEHRYAMTNRKEGIHVEAEYTNKGLEFLKELRRKEPWRFRRCVIRDVLQTMPTSIVTRVIYHREDFL